MDIIKKDNDLSEMDMCTLVLQAAANIFALILFVPSAFLQDRNRGDLLAMKRVIAYICQHPKRLY